MKKLFVLGMLLTPFSLWSQNVRYSAKFPSVASYVSPNSPILAVCNSPANGSPCTNYATTYTSLGATCPSGAQDTPDPQPSVCQATGDKQGNTGFWAPAGTYDYTVTVGKETFGPYTVTLAQAPLIAGSNITLTPTGNSTTISVTGGGGGGGPVQSSPVAGVNQYITQSAAGEIGSLFGTNIFNGIYYAPPPALPVTTCGANWQQSPTGTISAGANTVTLSCAPPGLLTGAEVGPGGNDFDAIALAGTGTPEYPLITETTCPQQGGSTSCTVTFTAVGNHSGGFTLGSASGGLQETLNAALRNCCGLTIGPILSGYADVKVPPGDYTLAATVTVMEYYGQTRIDFTGSVLYCTMSASCLYVGNPDSYNWVGKMRLIDLIFRAGVVNGNYAALEDNGSDVTVDGISALAGYTPVNASFGRLAQVDTDEAFAIVHMNTSVGGISPWHCGTDFCSEAIYIKDASPAPTGAIDFSNISMGCKGNGIDNWGGNGLRVSNTQIQGYAQFGIRSTSQYFTNLNLQTDNVYEEIGSCTNPLGTGIVGIAAEEGPVVYNGNEGGANGNLQGFADTGATEINYYIVVKDGSAASPPYPVGYALTNLSGPITVKWPEMGTMGPPTYDLISTSGTVAFSPYNAICGGGSDTACGSIATGLTQAGNCSNGVCSYTYTSSASTTAYSFTTPRYGPSLIGTHGPGGVPPLPGTFVLSKHEGDSFSGGYPSTLSGPHLSQQDIAASSSGPLGLVSVIGAAFPSVSALACGSVRGLWSPAWITCGVTADQVTAPQPPYSVAIGGAFNSGIGPSYQDVSETAAPSNPASGVARLYVNNATHVTTCLTSSGGNCSPAGTGGTVHDLHFAYGTPGGTALSTGILGYQTIPIGCTITGWNIEVDAGTATVKTLKVASGAAIPTLGSNSISTSGVSIASGTVIQSTTLTDFTTTTITAKDILAADMTAVSGVGYINFELITACAQ